MQPEVALVKLMWTLANAKSPEDISCLMRASLAGEISFSTPITV
jgi:L-asparaginase/Glu-tRNA(Gln) amidotransferase subunit D